MDFFYSGWILFVPCDGDVGACSFVAGEVDGVAGAAVGPLCKGCPVLEFEPLLELLLVDVPDGGCVRG